MVLQIIQAGNPILRSIAQPLEQLEIGSSRVRDLIEEMRETMKAAPGVGLAAPQIGQSLQIIVIEDSAELQSRLSKEQLDERERRAVPFHVLINPDLRPIVADNIDFFEGCLSVAGYTGLTPRYRSVEVNALNERGDEICIKASGWYARILQHEFDHLQGTLYIDRMHSRAFSTVSNKDQFWDLPSQLVRESLGI